MCPVCRLYAADQTTDLTPQERLRELLKEALFDEFHQVPYHTHGHALCTMMPQSTCLELH
jgi:hypothetical protein